MEFPSFFSRSVEAQVLREIRCIHEEALPENLAVLTLGIRWACKLLLGLVHSVSYSYTITYTYKYIIYVYDIPPICGEYSTHSCKIV